MPADVDAILGSGGDAPQALAVLDACDAVWRAGYRAAEHKLAREFIERHAVALAEVAQRYDGVIDDIRNDPGLRAYLAVAAARSGR
jgi:hypothetical protein